MARKGRQPNTRQGTGGIRGRQRPPRRPAKRKPNPYSGALYDPTAPLAGKALGQAVDRLVGLEFGPKRAALDREQANTTTQGLALIDRGGGYYKQLAVDQAQDVARQQAIGDKLKTALAGLRTQSDQDVTRAGQEADARAAQDTSVRGAGLEGGSGAQLASEIAAQRARASENATTNETGAAEGTAGYERLADLTSRATAARGGEVTQELGNRLANAQGDIRARRADLDTQAGGRRVEQLVNLRQSALENLIAMRGLNIKASDLQAQVEKAQGDQAIARTRIRSTERTNRARLRTTRRGQNIGRQTAQERNATTQRGQNLTQQTARERIAAQKRQAKGKPESPSAQKLRSGIENALTDIGSDPVFQRPGRATPNDWDRILTKRGAPGLVRRAAIERAQGGLTPQTAQALRGLGVKVPGRWLRRTTRHGKGVLGYAGPH